MNIGGAFSKERVRDINWLIGEYDSRTICKSRNYIFISIKLNNIDLPFHSI